MSLHDAWARITPYELGIPGRHFAERMFERIREEIEGRGTDATDPGAFAQLGEVGLAIRELQGDDRGGEALTRYGAFLFHAYHLHEAGEPLLLLRTAAAREVVVAGGPSGHGGAPWSGAFPAAAGYLQLPRHLFWAHPEEDPSGGGEAAPAEPLDGIFWARSAGDTLSLLVALGVRDDRPGLSVVEVPPVPLAEAQAMADREVREATGRAAAGGAGRDFETTLPGGELAGLHSVQTLGEVVKLAARVFRHVERHPEAVGPEERAPRPEPSPRPGPAPRPSLLPFRPIGPRP